jgi:hypothetical protein
VERQSGRVLLQIPQRRIVVAVLLDVGWAVARLPDKRPKHAFTTGCGICRRRNAVLTDCRPRRLRHDLRGGRWRRWRISAVWSVARRRSVRVVTVISRPVAIGIRCTCCDCCARKNCGRPPEQFPTHTTPHVLLGTNPIARACSAEITFRVCGAAPVFGRP